MALSYVSQSIQSVFAQHWPTGVISKLCIAHAHHPGHFEANVCVLCRSLQGVCFPEYFPPILKGRTWEER